MNSIDNKQKKKKKHHRGLWTSLIALCMTGMAPIIMGFMLFIICAGTVISVYFFDTKEEEQEVIDLSLCPCGDCSQGYEYIGNETTGGNTGGSTSGTDTTVAAHGKKITDTLLNPYDLPLYDGLTMDATQLGCDSWTVDFDAQNDITRKLSTTWKTAHDNRVKVGSTYGKNNYGPDAKCGTKVPYTDVDGRISMAIPWRYTYKAGVTDPEPNKSEWTIDKLAGRYFDVVFKDGTVLACIMGDAKGTEANTFDSWAHSDGSILEIVQYTDLPLKQYKGDTQAYAFPAKMAKDAGLELSYNDSGVPVGPNWSDIFGRRAIQKIVVYDKNYYTTSQGYKPWFTESLTKVSSAGSNITNNIIQNGIDAAQNAANNIQNGVNNTQGNTGGTANSSTTDTTGINGMTGGTSGELNLPSDINTLNTQDSDLVGKDNIEKIWNYFKSKGFNEYAIAGILGNMKSESGGSFDPGKKEGGKANADQADKPGGYGLIQWTNSGGADRKKLLFEYLEGRGLPKNSLAGQLDYVIVEHITKRVWMVEKNTDLLTKSGFRTYASYNFDSIERATYEFLYLAERPNWSKKYGSFEVAKESSEFKVRSSAANTYYSKFTGKTINNSTGGNTVPIGGNKTEVKTNVKLNYSAANVDVANWDGKVPKEYIITSCDPITINIHLMPDKNSNPQRGNIDSFIVHYWGNTFDKGEVSNGDNLYSEWSRSNLSSTFMMGTEGDIWQYAPMNKAPNTSNTNQGTLSVEVSNNMLHGAYSEKAYKTLVHLTAWICYTYNLDTDFNWTEVPKTHNYYWDRGPLRRHYDCLSGGAFRGKACPAYWCPNDGSTETTNTVDGGNLRWIAFKEDVTNFLIEYKDHQNFAPTNVNELAGYQESLSLIDKSKTPNWANGSVIYGQSDGNGNISSNLADYRGKGCGCKIPCPDCTCHDAQAEEIKNISQIGGTTSGEGSETGSDSSGGTMSDSDGIAIQGGEHLGTGGEGIYYTIDNNILTFKGDSWASTTFLKNARAVTQYYVAAGCGYVYGGSANVPPLGTVRIDCSGYISQVLKYCGYSNPYITSESDLTSQLGFQAVAFADMQPGDIVRYKGHVAIFCGWPNGQPTNRNYLAYNWGGQSDKTAYGAYAEPRLYGSDKRFIAAYRPVPPS